MNEKYSAHFGEDAAYQLTDAFLESEPTPLASFAQHDPEQRRGFLREFCRIGEPTQTELETVQARTDFFFPVGAKLVADPRTQIPCFQP